MNHLKIIHWNIEGINSQIYGNKTENEYSLNALNGHDIIAFMETQCNDGTPIHIPGYKVWRCTRQKHVKATKYSGGIAICIKQELVGAVKQIHIRSNDISWIRIQGEKIQLNNDIILGVVYVSPINSTYTKCLPEQVWDVLEEELLQFKDDEQILLAGDFNAHTGVLPDYIVNDDDVYSPVPDQYVADPEMCTRLNRDTNVWQKAAGAMWNLKYENSKWA